MFCITMLAIFGGHLAVALCDCVAASCVAVRSVAGALREDGIHSIHYFGTASVVEGDAQAHASVCSGLLGGFAYICLHSEGKFVDAAEKTHADVVPLDERHLFADIFTQQLHQEISFDFGAAPILDGKGVEG